MEVSYTTDITVVSEDGHEDVYLDIWRHDVENGLLSITEGERDQDHGNPTSVTVHYLPLSKIVSFSVTTRIK